MIRCGISSRETHAEAVFGCETAVVSDCVMCSEAEGVGTPLAFRDLLVAVFPARWQPVSNLGYALLVTRHHVPTLYELGDDVIGPVMKRVRDVARAVEVVSGASGTTIRQNNNPPGQEIDHLHFHIVPRFVGDGYWDAKPQEVDFQVRQKQAEVLRSALAEMGSGESQSDI